MELNINSFFVKTFLGVKDSHKLPRTICALARKVVWRLLYFPLVFSTIFGFIYLYIKGGVGTFQKGVMGFYNLVTVENVKTSDFLSFCAFYGFNVIVFALSVALLFTLADEYNMVHKVKHNVFKMEDKPKNYYGPSKFRQFVSGLYSRAKDKTCVVINYKD